MTRTANRNNIKSVLGQIAFVMIVLCLLTARAFQSVNPRQFADLNGLGYCGICPILLWMHSSTCIAFFASSVTLVISLVFLCLVAFCGTAFTNIYMAVCSRFIFMELRKWFNFLAMSAGFCYNWARHNFLSLQKNVVLEPSQTLYLCGLLYNNTKYSKVNNFFKF